MQFTTRKRRQPPAIIIISLIDILIVLLIFLMVTTTFKQRPAVKITLPESKQATKGVTEDRLVVIVNKQEPYFYLNTLPVTLEKLQENLQREAKAAPNVRVTISADEASTTGNAFKVLEVARAVGIAAACGRDQLLASVRGHGGG
jgi:biopolymer transport protein ExbD